MGSIAQANGPAAGCFGLHRAGSARAGMILVRRAKPAEADVISAAADQAANPVAQVGAGAPTYRLVFGTDRQGWTCFYQQPRTDDLFTIGTRCGLKDVLTLRFRR